MQLYWTSLVIFAPNRFFQHCVRFYHCTQRRIMCAWHCQTYGMAGAIAYLYTYIIQLISTVQFKFRRTTSRPLVYPPSFTRVVTSKRSAPRQCALNMFKIARNFTHQASIHTIRNPTSLAKSCLLCLISTAPCSFCHRTHPGPQIKEREKKVYYKTATNRGKR